MGKSIDEHKAEINKLVERAIGKQSFSLVEGTREKLEILTMQLRKMHKAEERDAFTDTDVVKKESTKHFDAMMK